MKLENALFEADIVHKRLIPKVNKFLYKGYYICFDIAQIEKLQSVFFSLNKFNIFSFYNRDHGARSNDSCANWIKETLQNENIKIDGKIYLLTLPRILGYVFNPVSFWFCLNSQNQLQAVLAEVNNTFKESHNYLIYEKNGEALSSQKFYEANKNFYVSPFMKVEGKYKFRFVFDDEKIAIWIDYFDNESKLMLMTSLIGKRYDLTSLSLLRNFVTIPFNTFKIIFLIHFQAIKLFFKKIKYIKRPKKSDNNITRNYE